MRRRQIFVVAEPPSQRLELTDFTLSPHFVERIEGIRQSDVSLTVRFAVYGVEARHLPLQSETVTVLLANQLEAAFDVPMTIPQSQWVTKILPRQRAMGLRETFGGWDVRLA